MKKEWLVKTLALSVVVLFISVSFQPIIAKDTISPEKKSDAKELLETILDIVNNKEIQDIIQKSEIKGSPIRFQQLLGRLLKELIGFIEKNEVIKERIKQLSDLPCDCEKDNKPLWYPKLLCGFLYCIAFAGSMWYLFKGGGERLANICLAIINVLNCPPLVSI